jgi:hypothetical protein
MGQRARSLNSFIRYFEAWAHHMKIDFDPKLSLYDLEYYLNKNHERLIENNRIHCLALMLANKAFPSYQDKFDRRWENFYLPVRRSGRKIAFPFVLSEYQGDFHGYAHRLGSIYVRKGEKAADVPAETIFSELLRFIPVANAMGKNMKKLIPYDMRTGKIKGRHILAELLAPNIRNSIEQRYHDHISRSLEIADISLNEYMATAKKCYEAAYTEEARGLAPLEMYKRWADTRDGGMLSIADWDSREEFHDWLLSDSHAGAHPFEIVFSWHSHGIHLYPPNVTMPHYKLTVTNFAYAPYFIKMVQALIEAGVPFTAYELDKVLDFLSGDTYFTVNDYDEHSFSYIPSREYRKKYFPYIEWDDIKILKWKEKDDHMGCMP